MRKRDWGSFEQDDLQVGSHLNVNGPPFVTEPTLEDQDSEESFEELHQRLVRLERVRQTDLMREMGLHRPPLRDSDSVKTLMDSELAGWSAEQRNLVSPYWLDSPHFHVREWEHA